MAHAAPTAMRRYRQTSTDDTKHLSWVSFAGPLVLGLFYGLWTAFIDRDKGPVTVANVFYGILCGALFAACVYGLDRIGSRLMREVHAAAYGAFAAIAMGYLYSLSGQSVLRSTCIGLAVGAGVGLAAFYRFYTREP
ncbi:hypothetical protein MTF65_14585 [Streptomyces sp. APSN-46.1]|uniref:hypothetical protein n=1 Tax=Streptomyces sp. APSN-46.1 TaxID=2929049 RepID=UPI001FB4BA81|nr:hypothetical protein [Streptomyces sp. APSN-46.1]MCJ1678554.1 hypothetical protein [Streptomyces sp. APSN-46.1]